MKTALLLALSVGQAPPATPSIDGAPGAGAASAPASRPALSPGGTGRDVQADLTVIYEIDEHHLKTQESWSLSNTSGKRIEPDSLVFALPENARRLRLDENVEGFTAPEAGQRFFATAPLLDGNHGIGAAYLTDLVGDSVTVPRSTPVNLRTVRVIIQNVSGLQFSASLPHDHRIRDLNGLEFAIFTLGPVPAGSSFEYGFDGLPSRSALPSYIALAVSLGLVGWMIFALTQPQPKPVRTMGVLSAEARRDRLLRALELLDRDRAENKIKPRRYTRRHEELMSELADVLREADRVEGDQARREVKGPS